jgi:hypothetical protein
MVETPTMTQTQWKNIFSRDVLGYDENYINFMKKEQQEQTSMDPWWLTQSAPWNAEIYNFYGWKEKFSKQILRLNQGKWGWISNLMDFYHTSPHHPNNDDVYNSRYSNWYEEFYKYNGDFLVSADCEECGLPDCGNSLCDYCAGDYCRICGKLGCGAYLCYYCRRYETGS